MKFKTEKQAVKGNRFGPIQCKEVMTGNWKWSSAKMQITRLGLVGQIKYPLSPVSSLRY